MSGALEGLRVADFGQGVAGPHIGLLFANHGADVTKVEPLKGDWVRTLGQNYDDLTAYSVHYNRGKRSIAVDLKTQEGREIALKIASEADVVIESFRPGIMKKFDLDYETLRKVNDKVIYVSVTGFGQTGKDANLPATDGIIQAYSGIMSLNRDKEGIPQRFGMIIIDVVAGLYGFQAVMAALIKRGMTGKGRYIDCNLLQSALALQAPRLVQHHFEGGRKEVMYVPLGVYRTSDSFISLSVHQDQWFKGFCEAIDRPELADDPRYQTRLDRVAHENELNTVVRAELQKRTTQYWSERLTKYGILNSIIKSYDDILADRDLVELGYLEHLPQDGIDTLVPAPNTPGAISISQLKLTHSPHIGEHTREILQDMGFAPSAVQDLYARNIVTTHKAQGKT